MTFRGMWAIALACLIGGTTRTQSLAQIEILYASVQRQNGDMVSSLSPTDFAIHVDGQPVEAASVSMADHVSVVLALDISASMTWRRLDLAVDQFTSRLRPADKAQILGFATEVWTDTEFRSDVGALRQFGRLLLAKPMALRHGPSPVWDAIDTAVQLLATQAEPRGIIALTDGRASGNRVGLQDVTARANQLAVSISVAADRDRATTVGRGAQGYAQTNPAWMLEWLTDQTAGGFLSDPRDASKQTEQHPGPQLARLLSDLQMTHAIRLKQPIAAAQLSSVVIEVRRAGFVVRKRGTARPIR